MPDLPTPESPTFSREELRRVIERAVALHDERQLRITQAELEVISSELGLPPDIVAAAVADLQQQRQWKSGVAPAAAWIVAPTTMTLLGVCGMFAVVVNESIALPVVEAAAVINLLLAADASAEHAYRRFVRRSAGLWLGFLGAAVAAYSDAPAMLGFAAGTVVVGMGIIALLRGLQLPKTPRTWIARVRSAIAERWNKPRDNASGMFRNALVRHRA